MSEYNNCKPEIIGLDVEKGWTTNWPIEPNGFAEFITYVMFYDRKTMISAKP